ncbi:hypothetical protein H5410_031992 [Solanum commersonii]|uniref:Uncharacterized protein n=1 Tax=Solanum commersonii TaxID=4109 RepID=A0A9J5YP14_SOLCO|nr:hypothetical protein H5410_031992 [Solanum commersonii]
MQTRGRNRLDIQLQNDEDEQNIDQAQPYIEQLMNSQNHSQTQDYDDPSNGLNNFIDGIDESSNSEARKVCGPILVKDIWKLHSGKIVDGRKLSSLLGIIARTPELTPLHVDDWRNFDNEEKKKLINFVRRHTQANRNNRTKQKMPHTRGSKSIATLMNQKDIINEKMSNSYVYAQVLGNKRIGYVCGLGLGPTPSALWGSRTFLENIDEEDSSNEIVQRLEQEINELKDKQNEEINIMKQNQDFMQLELLQM